MRVSLTAYFKRGKTQLYNNFQLPSSCCIDAESIPVKPLRSLSPSQLPSSCSIYAESIPVKPLPSLSPSKIDSFPFADPVFMMARTVKITIKSASGLDTARTYAVAWINNHPDYNNRRKRTPVDTQNGNNPIWNHDIDFTLEGTNLVLEIGIYTGRDKEIGSTSLPLMQFLNSAGCWDRQLELSGHPDGSLHISVKTDANATEILQKGLRVAGKVVEGSGHTVPEYKPKEALPFCTWWLDGKPFGNATGSRIFDYFHYDTTLLFAYHICSLLVSWFVPC